MKWQPNLIICLMLLGVPGASAQPLGCSQAQIGEAAKTVIAGRQALLRLPIGDGLQTDVSPGASEALSRMKTTLNGFVAAYMRCLPVSSEPDTVRIERDLSAFVNAYRMPPGLTKKEDLPKDFGKYGFELYFEAKSSSGRTPLMSVTTSFAIECGTDTMLMVFAPRNGVWEEVLLWQSPSYDTVAGAFGSFQYGISPPDSKGHWYLVATRINPWCSSAWQQIYYSVLRPATGSLQPQVLLSESHSIYLGDLDVEKLTVNLNQFDLRFHAESIDSGVLVRPFIGRYKVDGNTVTRTEPVADSPPDFVDEWLVSPWEEARQWSLHSNLQRLESAHQKASGRTLSYEAVRQCSGTADRYEIELSNDQDQNQDFFFDVDGGPFFIMRSVSLSANPACAGPNILSTMQGP